MLMHEKPCVIPILSHVLNQRDFPKPASSEVIYILVGEIGIGKMRVGII